MNTFPSRLLFSLACLAPFAGCYGDKLFVEDGAGGSPASTSTSGGAPSSGGNGAGGNGTGGNEAGGNGTGASAGDAPGGAGGAGPECTSLDQCPMPSSECVERRCDNMVCTEVNKTAGEICAGVRVCDGAGACVVCISNAQCTMPDTCDLKTNECAPPLCSNGALNAGETDIDCGGADCPPCQNGDDCLLPSDCTSHLCTVALVCAPCSGDGQCNATDYCDGGSCVPKLPNGLSCANNGQCANGACAQTGIGGICCNSTCNGTCMSCAIGDTGAATGTCAPVQLNLDPKSECPTQACRTGSCNGTGSCGVLASGTTCTDNLFCNGTDTCNASGSCTTHTGNPCPADVLPDSDCSETCDEATDTCTANDLAGTPCTDNQFCTQTDTCNGSGVCSGTGNPCTGPLCTDACNEGSNNCTALQPTGSTCNADGDFVLGTCNATGVCND